MLELLPPPVGTIPLLITAVEGLIKLAPVIRNEIADLLKKEEPTKDDVEKLRNIVSQTYESFAGEDPFPPAAAAPVSSTLKPDAPQV